MSWLNPKVDWTEDDFFNFDDLDRIENNVDAVSDLISSYQNAPNLGSINTSRDNTSVDYCDDFKRIETNIDILKLATHEPPENWTTPVTDWESGDIFDYEDANRLEKNLLALYLMVNETINMLLKCGAINSICGQNGSYL